MNIPSCLYEPDKRMDKERHCVNYFSLHVNLCSSVCLCSAKQNQPSLSLSNLQERSDQLWSTVLVCNFKVYSGQREKKKKTQRHVSRRWGEKLAMKQSHVSWILWPPVNSQTATSGAVSGGLSFELLLSGFPKSPCATTLRQKPLKIFAGLYGEIYFLGKNQRAQP